MANGGIIGPVQNPAFGSETITEFTSSGSYSNPASFSSADILVIAAGGSNIGPGGNGGGGFREISSHPITPGTTYPITIGTAAGSGESRGGASQFGGPTTPAPQIIATTGGGYGGDRHANGQPGGSAGGAGDGATPGPVRQGGTGNDGGYSPPEGNPGGNGTPSPLYEPAGGGGGAGGAGGHGGPQGAGATSSITGTPVMHSQGGSGDGGSMTNPNNTGGYGHGAKNYSNSGAPVDNRSYPGYIVVKTGAFSNASGVWNMNDVVQYRKEGTWGG